MLRFELRQVYIPSLERFFLPLPKLSVAQRGFLAEHLKERGFETKQVGGGRLSARKGKEWIMVSGTVGVAKSNTDLLDPLGPVIPRLLRFARERPASSSLYFELKKSKKFTEIQFFPRLESLGTWTALRGDGLSGLTPDEALVLRRLLEGAGDVEIDCVSTNPRDASTPTQICGKAYYRSRVPAKEFLDSLRDIGFNPSGDTYLPRSSIIILARASSLFDAVELGEWCYAAF